MLPVSDIYRHSLALLTDLYELTMAYGYWKLGRSEHEAVFHLFFRSAPFASGYTIAAGLEYVIDVLRHFRFDREDLAYLATLTGDAERPLFDEAFLDYLRHLKLEVDVDAVPEGTVVYPQEPLLRVVGPIAHCQLVETILLNLVNYQTLVATKAARICAAAGGEPVSSLACAEPRGPMAGWPRAARRTSADALRPVTCLQVRSLESRCAALMRIAG